MPALLIVGPSLPWCALTAEAHGLVPGQIENFRNVTRAYQLRGAGPGQPFITHDRDQWPAEARELDKLVTALVRAGRLRIARAEDIDNSRTITGAPFRRGRWNEERARA